MQGPTVVQESLERFDLGIRRVQSLRFIQLMACVANVSLGKADSSIYKHESGVYRCCVILGFNGNFTPSPHPIEVRTVDALDVHPRHSEFSHNKPTVCNPDMKQYFVVCYCTTNSARQLLKKFHYI